MRAFAIAVAAIAAALLIAAQFITIVVIQPIGAIPDGRTIIVTKIPKFRIVESADSFCAREGGGVSLLCRGAVLAAVAQNSEVIARLPYSHALYLWTTNGVEYDR